MMSRPRVRPGSPRPLGATWTGQGTNFALYSESATAVDLCLFDATGRETRIPLRHRTEFVWHAFVEAVGPGQLYGYRVNGPWEPREGLRFNPHSVLLDPYAKALSGIQDWTKGGFSYDIASTETDKDLVRVQTDQRAAPLGVVIDPSFDWGSDAPPNVPMRTSLIYEAHVKGMTARHPDVPPELRGTYLGLATEPIIGHLRQLGVTAIELLPIHGFVDDAFLLDRGLKNYWGYHSIAFFAPDVRYRSGGVAGQSPRFASEVDQFKRMVKTMHAAGIEVILDVVYNHTAEGNHLGPTLSLKGIDNPTYYRLVPDDKRYYFDYTGTGNTLNVRHPQALQLIMDSLRYWVQEMHVDGFRFDLASTLARSLHEVDRLSSFFTVIHQDPILSRVKLIAEPWDVGEGGYQVGQFPVRWAEWNGKYRDTMRAFWRGDGGSAADLGYRLTGSADLYQADGRRPSASVNFITAHDGFTLADLVSFNHKHNEANREDNRDGADDNGSWNCGAEGETGDAAIRALRQRQERNLLATLLLSQGTPMICGGDELGRSQRGNNNAYCQDNEISWLDWELDDERRALLEFTKRLVRLRHDHPLVQRDAFFRGRVIRGVGVRDLVWFRHDGAVMTDQDWQNHGTSSLGMFVAGSGLDPTDAEGRPQSDDDLVLLINASGSDLEFVIPPFAERMRGLSWRLLLDTAEATAPGTRVDPGSAVKLASHSLKLFARRAIGVGGLQSVQGAPVSTYRLQLHAKFGFRDALAVVDYIDELGAGGLYSSPILRAERGSPHGYDVVDHAVLNPELGSDEEQKTLSDALKARRLQYLVDFVPNHVGIGSGENAWWRDVLENGPSSVFADFFDVEWNPPSGAHRGKVLLPILGRQFGDEVDDGAIHVVREGGALLVAYHDKRLPASPRSYRVVLDLALGQVDLPEADVWRRELESVRTAITHLPSAESTAPSHREERAREKEIIKRRLFDVCRASPEVAVAVDAAAAGISASATRLEAFLGEQNYRLSYWRVANEEINYRRFFDINELAAIRMEEPDVFAATHVRLFELIADGRVTGIRLDHTDGLYDPNAYFGALQQGARDAMRRGGVDRGSIYAVAEKILGRGEKLPRSWPIAGTVGYDFLAAINGIWVDATAEKAVTAVYVELGEGPTDFRAAVRDAKRDVIAGSFASEIHVLSGACKRIAERSRHARDFTLESLRRVTTEVISAFPVYRSYVQPDGAREGSDEAYVRAAVGIARRRSPMIESSTFDFLERVLLLREPGSEAMRFAMRFQQLTGPIMAKGVEDTTLYRYTRLIALNEVGCDAGRFGSSTSDFHRHNASILAEWPLSMTATSTHDTKFGEDVRARIAVLSEIPDEWAAFVRTMTETCAASTTVVDGVAAPSRADAYLFWQVAVGAWPFEGLVDDAARKTFTERIAAYMEKAIHEAKVHTSWTAPNTAYDRAVQRFVHGVLDSNDARGRIAALVERIAPYGASNGLAQLALRLASPGVPDIYQGCELWSLSLVDPDNRRPVDFELRRRHLTALRSRGAPTPELASELVRTFADGRIKLHVTAVGLRLRRELPGLFVDAGYAPIDAGEHVVAFERAGGGRRLVCVVPRLALKLSGGKSPWPLGDAWRGARLELRAAGRFENVFTGERLEGASLLLDDVFRTFPVAWLVASSTPARGQ